MRRRFAQCLSRHLRRFIANPSTVVPLDYKPCLLHQIRPFTIPRDVNISNCNCNVCLCACCRLRGIVRFFHRLASWQRTNEWISDGNGDTIAKCQNPHPDGVLFPVHPDAFQMDRTFFHKTRSGSASARYASPMERYLLS